MAKNSQDVTEAELAVLQALWEQGAATVRVLTDRLYPAGDNSGFATVQKLLERLESKRFVRRVKDSSPRQFEPAVSKDQLIGRRLKALAETLCEGSLTPLLTSLLSAGSIDESQRRELRDLIDQLDSRQPKRR
jgi:predicted transcriptional regulator